MKLHIHKNLDFHLMSFKFRLRDMLCPPIRILQESGVRLGMTVLDFGCGPGSFSLAAARLVGPQGRVYALDINPLALRIVYRAATRKDLRNVHPIHGRNIDDLMNESIDFVIVYDVLHDIPEPVSVLAEIHRVLKTNGVLSICDRHLQGASLMSTVPASGFFQLAGCKRWTCQFWRIGTDEVLI